MAVGDPLPDHTHFHKPTPLVISGEIVRVFFGVRDATRTTRTYWVDFGLNDRHFVAVNRPQLALDIGPIGAYDDSGTNVSSVVTIGSRHAMYSIGWSPSQKVHTKNFVGLSFSPDGNLFEREHFGPVMGPNYEEPFYIGAVHVIPHNSGFRMYYTCGLRWVMVHGRPEIQYEVRFCESPDGVNWIRTGVSCLGEIPENVAYARPWVVRRNDSWFMFYSKRSLTDFRENNLRNYSIEAASSVDGIHFQPISGGGIVWAGEPFSFERGVQAYPALFSMQGRDFLLFNGADFGKDGFGVAEVFFD